MTAIPSAESIAPFTMETRLLAEHARLPYRSMGFCAKTPQEARAWRDGLRAKLREMVGWSKFQHAPLDPVITEELDFGDYTRQRVVIQTEPGVLMPMFVLIPKNAAGPLPAVLAPHGHASGGKRAVVGERKVPWLAKFVDELDYDYGVQFARAGFISFCPDARGFGERLEATYRTVDQNASSCEQIQILAQPLGMSLAGMWAWDLLRLVDYVQTRADCAPGRIGCAGLSGGGLQTLWTAAMDAEERIGCFVVSGYFYGWIDTLMRQRCCGCNYVPGLPGAADMGDLGALAAPRPLLIETGDEDYLNGVTLGMKNVYSQVKITREAYDVLGAGDRLKHHVDHGGHKWYRAGIPWMTRWIGK